MRVSGSVEAGECEAEWQHSPKIQPKEAQEAGKGSGKAQAQMPLDDAAVVAATRERIVAVLAAQARENKALEARHLQEIRR